MSKGLSFLAAALALAAAPARAAGLNLGISQSFGTDEYEATNVYAAVGWGGFSFAPELKRYSHETSEGAQSAVQARLGYDSRLFGLGVTGGSSLKRDGFQAVYGGADVALTLSPGGEDGIRRIGGPGRSVAPVGKGIARVDVGGGFMTSHFKQDATAAVAESGLTQHEVHGFVGASVIGLLLSVRGSRFLYNDDLNGRGSVPSRAWTPVGGLVPYVNGFAKESVHVRGEFALLPLIRPSIHYTFASFEKIAGVQPGDKRAVGFGVAVGLELVAVEASYQHINTTGAKDTNLVSVGATLRL